MSRYLRGEAGSHKKLNDENYRIRPHMVFVKGIIGKHLRGILRRNKVWGVTWRPSCTSGSLTEVPENEIQGRMATNLVAIAITLRRNYVRRAGVQLDIL